MAKTTLQVSIPEPCHEDWAQMTPTQCGAFCKACQKEVVDFSRMSEAEIIDRLSKASGKVCGRIPTTMLDRELVKHEPDHAWYSWKKWAVAAGVILGVGNVKGSDNAPKPIAQTDSTAQAKLQPIVHTAKGDTIAMQDEAPILPVGEKITLIGWVADEENMPIPFATVMLDGTDVSVATDEEGVYSLSLPAEKFYNKMQKVTVHANMYTDSTRYILIDSLYKEGNLALKPALEITREKSPLIMAGGMSYEIIHIGRVRFFFMRLAQRLKEKRETNKLERWVEKKKRTSR